MKFAGKLVGAVLGYALVRHPIGLALGLALGHAWDEGALQALLRELRPAPRIRAALQDPLFALAGAVAKSDGRVSDAEIAAAEALMQRMGLAKEQRARAIARFNSGKESGFDVQHAGRELRAFCGFDGALKLVMLEVLTEVAVADGQLAPESERVLERIARALDTTRADYEAILARKRPSPDLDPYATLGIAPAASDDEVRQAYRRIMSECHPDRLAGKSLTPAERATAETRARDANRAYDRIKERRGFK